MSLALERERPRANTTAGDFGGRAALGVAVLLLAAAAVVLALRWGGPPAAVSEGAPASEFSSGRAMKRLAAIAARPHPIGSAEHAAVRDYIVGALAESGVGAEVQGATVVNQNRGGSVRAASVSNVVARVKGTGQGKAVMLAAHYDSVPNSPGAADDGAGVAALLETARALKTGPPLKNDVIFLFTDGEEPGLLGARAFVDEHPWAKDVAAVFNFEARGNSGPSIMFETSGGNNWLVREFAAASPRPVANSLSYEIYRLMPNDTDLTVFKGSGMAGMNFAFIMGVPHYHARIDSVEGLDERSLQHHGSNALAVARHFGGLDLQAAAKTDAVYFDVLGLFLVNYPSAWALPLAALAALAFVVVAFVGVRRRRMTPKGVALGALALLLSMACAYGVVWVAWWALRSFYTGYSSMPQWLRYGGDLYLAGFVALTLAAMTALYIVFRRRADALSLTAGALVWWVALSLLSAVMLPGASYLFTWPLLFSLAGVLLVVMAKGGVEGEERVSAPVYLALFAVPGLMLFGPLVQLIYVGLGPELSAALMVVVVLALGLLVPHLSLLGGARRWVLPGALAAVGVGVIALSVVTAGFDKSRPRANHLFYGADASTGRNVWASFDERPDAWTGQVIPAGSGRAPLNDLFQSPGTAKFLQSEAPPAGLAPPHVTVVEDRTEGDQRQLRLRVDSARDAESVYVQLNSEAELFAVEVNGKRVDFKTPVAVGGEKRWGMRYYALPKEGFEMSLRVRPKGPLKLSIFDQSHGLPQVAGSPLRPRPDDLMPAPHAAYSDATLVSNVYTF
ncbi:MAG TPA: M20/M25/M40 family metallo-hydrolase [Pyrinomonadaceae bacterium]|jgi:hypothetical protein